MLRESDCHLPGRRWGRIDLAASAPRAGRDWTDDGTARQARGLKHRAWHENPVHPHPARPGPDPPRPPQTLRHQPGRADLPHRTRRHPPGQRLQRRLGRRPRRRPHPRPARLPAGPPPLRPAARRRVPVAELRRPGHRSRPTRRAQRRRPAQDLRPLHRRTGRRRQQAHRRRPRRRRGQPGRPGTLTSAPGHGHRPRPGPGQPRLPHQVRRPDSAFPPVRTASASARHASSAAADGGRYRDRMSRGYDRRTTQRPGKAGGPAEATLRLVQDRDRIAGPLNDVVISRIVSAGLALETALGLLGGHRAAGKVPGSPRRAGAGDPGRRERPVRSRAAWSARRRAAGLGRLGRGPARGAPSCAGSLDGDGRVLGAGEDVRHAGQQGPYRRIGHPVKDRPRPAPRRIRTSPDQARQHDHPVRC